MTKSIKKIGFAENTQALLSCLLVHMLVPLIPMILEAWWREGGLTNTTATLTAAMYSISIGISSRSQGIFSLSLVIGLIFSVLFGLISSNPTIKIPYILEGSLFALMLVIGVHFCERFNKHYIEHEPFWLFSNKINTNIE